jgi:hypothetical protein
MENEYENLDTLCQDFLILVCSSVPCSGPRDRGKPGSCNLRASKLEVDSFAGLVKFAMACYGPALEGFRGMESRMPDSGCRGLLILLFVVHA